jgi:CRISPR/Cas system CMR subunit Cmr4 (Cas7 group RAMP superfamily)
MIYLARFVIELKTPLHCGCGEGQYADQPVDRDALGLYRIPGSSLAGICRSAVRSWSDAQATVAQAFGAITPGQNEGQASAIWFSDGRLLDFDGAFADEARAAGRPTGVPLGPFLRDHVKLDLESGVGVPGGKFDEEYVPAGLRFALEICLDGWDREPSHDSLQIFLQLGRALERGQLRFGGKAAEGFGKISAIYAQGRRFDLTAEKGLVDWLNLSPGPRFADQDGQVEGEPLEFVEPPEPAGHALRGALSLPMEAAGPLLAGGTPSPDSAEADIVFYREPFCDYEAQTARWVCVLPGSSLRGALRHRVHFVASTLLKDPKELVEAIFGDIDDPSNPRRGKIFFEDARLPTAKEVIVPHVAIDRFTGGALESALYFEAPLWSQELTFSVNVEFENLTAREAAILAQAFFDLADGRLAVGAGGNRGNGFLRLKNGLTKEGFLGVGGEVRWDGESLSAQNHSQAALWLDKLDQALQAAQV